MEDAPGRSAEAPTGGGRFRLWFLGGALPLVVKQGPADPLAREAQALRLLEGSGLAPELAADGPGVLVTRRRPGDPQPLAGLSPQAMRRLGALIRSVHEAHTGRSGRLPGWPAAVRTLAGYRRRRAADALAAARGRERTLARMVVAALPPGPASREFRLLHGDLVESNVVWGPGPALVDWEFWRLGDPAEDLAYLAETNGLGDSALRTVIGGYGDSTMIERVAHWRALVALDAGLWYARAGNGDEAERLLRRAEALTPGRRAPGRSRGR